jgi:RHS repeat-associated protein
MLLRRFIQITTGNALPWQPTQTTCASTATPAGNILDLKYNYNSSSQTDNGNVMGITNNRDTTRSQSFAYDQVNRISTAQTSSTSGSNCWGETYGYDQWANLTNIGAVSGYSGCTQESLSVSAGTNNQLTATGYTYDALGNMLTDASNTYVFNAESEIKTAASVNYTYDGDGDRVEKSNGKIYWYGAGTEILDESDASGNFTDEYVFFAGKRIAHRSVSSNTIYYYAEDLLGTSRTLVQAGQTSLCYDADFYPFGGERDITTTCSQNYKFESKERDTETGNDDFDARYYSSRMGRWLSADWSAVPMPVPYANLSNPQTLNLYAMVSDNPETFADLDGHYKCECGIPEAGGGGWAGDESTDNYDSVEATISAHGWTPISNALSEQYHQAQQQNHYGRQADGSYKADPAKVKAAIDSKTPIGNGQCVAACSRLSGVTPHTDSWTPGASVLSLNDTTDVGLAIASFGPNGKFTQPGGDQNSAIYMGHDKAGNVMVVDQWPPPNKPQYNAPFEHPLANYGPNSTQRMENNASFYHVIVVP